MAVTGVTVLSYQSVRRVSQSVEPAHCSADSTVQDIYQLVDVRLQANIYSWNKLQYNLEVVVSNSPGQLGPVHGDQLALAARSARDSTLP